LWEEKQHILQNLNPREETRDWSRSNLILSIPPFIHATRHFGGETYMDVADFGPIFEGDPPQGTSIGSLFAGTKFGKWVGKVATKVGDLMEGADTAIGGAVAGIDSFFGGIDFNKEGGRLQFLTDKMIKQIPDDGGFGGLMTNMRSAHTPFGRPPKVPTQVVFSQKGAFGRGSIHQQTAETGISGNQIQKYKSLSYGELDGKYLPHSSPFPSHGRGGAYNLQDIFDFRSEMTDTVMTDDQFNAIELDFQAAYRLYHADKTEIDQLDKAVREYGKKIKAAGNINHQIGDPGKQSVLVPVSDIEEVGGSGLGIIKKNSGATGTIGEGYKSTATDKINIHPYGKDLPEDVSDFIKFKFKDIVNNKFIIFRAILSGISDSITPEWAGTQFIGRPDKVYVYQGTERKISFTFEIFPKTKQEFPVLLEKLNYLVGLCYPTFTGGNRMIAPFIELTLGDMFHNTPGFLDSLSVDVDDNSPWEIEEGLQFPHHITCQCSFTYIGKYLPSTLGKHYELDWLKDKGWSDGKKGTFEGENEHPTRTGYNKLFGQLASDNG